MATVAAYSFGDSLSSRLIASRTSAPPSVAFVPSGKGTRVAEFMELSEIGKVARVVANYSA